MKIRTLILILLVVLTSAAIVLIAMRRQTATAAPAKAVDEHGHDAGTHDGVTIAGLTISPVVVQPVTPVLSVTGEVQADEEHTAKVGAPVAGRLTRLTAAVGQAVRQGQTLAVVASRDVAEIQAALTRAQADAQAAHARVNTVRELARTGALTQKPLEEARANHTAAQAAVKQATAALARAQSAHTLAGAQLARTRKLADANAYQARPVEEASGAVAAAQAELETAQARVKVTQAAYDRAKRLFDAGVVARREVEQAEGAWAEANAQEREARTHLNIAQRTLAREERIAEQHLYTNAEIQNAEHALRQAEKEVDSCRAELQRARGNLTLAQSVLQREDVVAKKSLYARQEVDAAQAELLRAQADVTAGRQALDALRAVGGPRAGRAAEIAITAPIDGVIIERQATPGQAVEASTDLFTIVDPRHVWVWANVYEKDLARIRQGQPVTVQVASFPGNSFPGTVAYIGGGLKAETRTARIRCHVANPSGALRIGMFATVHLSTGRPVNAILIPKKAVLDDGGTKIVYSPCMECPEDQASGTNACGAYDKFEVTLGATYGDLVEVVRGLQPGLAVVTTGQYQLKTALGSGQLEAGCTDH